MSVATRRPSAVPSAPSARSARQAYKPRSSARISKPSSSSKSKLNLDQMSDEEKAEFLSTLAARLYGGYDDNKLTSLAPDLNTIKTGIKDLFPSQIAEAERDVDGNWITNLTLRWQRHAQGYHNLGMWNGADAPLTPEGVQQSRDLGTAFAQSLNLGEMQAADISFKSTLNRCDATHIPVGEATRAHQASQKDLPFTNQEIWLPLIREQISSHDGRPGASHVDQSRQFDGPFWNAAGAKGTEDTWDGYLKESHGHVKDRMYEALVFYLQTASEFTQHTGKSNVVLSNTAHADNGRQLATILHELAGVEATDYNTGYFNTEMKDFHLRIKTDAKTGEISLLPQDNGKFVKFGKGIVPEFGRQYRDVQAANRKQSSSMSGSSSVSAFEQSAEARARTSKLSSDTLLKLRRGLNSYRASTCSQTVDSEQRTEIWKRALNKQSASLAREAQTTAACTSPLGAESFATTMRLVEGTH